MIMHKIFKLLLFLAPAFPSLILADIETDVLPDTLVIKEPVYFKDEVPIHPGVQTKDGKDVNTKPRFTKDPQGKFVVYVSYDKKDCEKAHYDSLNEDQYDYLLREINNGAKIPFFDESSLATKTFEEKKNLLRWLHDAGTFQGFENIFKSSSKKNKKIVTSLFEELRCLADIDFFTKDMKDYSYDPDKHYKLSICETEPSKLIETLNKNGITWTIEKNGILNQSFIVIDMFPDKENRRLKSVAPKNKLFIRENNKMHPELVGHELLHALGLYHPNYSSYKEYMRYPSMSVNVDENSPITKNCVKNIKNDYVHPDTLLKYNKCLNRQTQATPTDVKTLHQIFGHSLNNSEKCLKIRKKFKEKYSRDVEDIEEDYYHNHDNETMDEL